MQRRAINFDTIYFCNCLFKDVGKFLIIIEPQIVHDADVVNEALSLEGIDEVGLDALDRTYLQTIATTYDGGPVGVEAVAATMGEDAGTLQDVVEPYLLQAGFLARTRQGRQITPQGHDRLKMDNSGS